MKKSQGNKVLGLPPPPCWRHAEAGFGAEPHGLVQTGHFHRGKPGLGSTDWYVSFTMPHQIPANLNITRLLPCLRLTNNKNWK